MEKYMKEAIRAAEKGRGNASPNPLVGAVIVKKGKIIARAWHEKYGGKHAEAIAISKIGKKAKGAELYVTLEPCNHYGKQPPCTKAIIQAGIKKVYIGIKDPNKTSKKGIKELEKNGIITHTGILRREIEKQNQYYIKSLYSQRPFITLKIAMTEEGFINQKDGERILISGKEAFQFVQKMRKEHDAVLVGVNTIIKDNPHLSVREDQDNNPVRIILDSRLKTPISSNIFLQKGETIIFCSKDVEFEKRKILAEKGALVISAKTKNKTLSLRDVLKQLFAIGIQSVLVEGGKKITTSFLSEKLADRLIIIVSNRKINNGLKAFTLKKKMRAKIVEKIKLGKDTMLILEVVEK